MHHTYTISAGESHDEDNMGPQIKQNTEKKERVSLRHYTGAALITYYYKGKKRLLPVEELKSLSSIAYP